jgi:hypothetical protein
MDGGDVSETDTWGRVLFDAHPEAGEGMVREIAQWLMHIDRLDEIPGAKAGLPDANPLWDAGVKLAKRYGVEL